MCKHTQQLPLCSTSDKGNMFLHCWTHYQWTTEQSDVGYSMSTKDNMQKLVYRNTDEETRPLLP